MIRRLAFFILLGTLSHTEDIPGKIPLTVAECGKNLDLTCPVLEEKPEFHFWYKQRFGHKIETVATGTDDKLVLAEQFKNSRFNVAKVGARHYLTIKNVSKEDEATYFCQTGSVYTQKFTNATVLVVNDCKKEQKSLSVKQSLQIESTQTGEPMTIECSLLSQYKENGLQCPGEHSVYWFRSGSGKSHPGIIYAHRSDEDEKKSCVYSLPRTTSDPSEDGTYYCAVVTCGEILFGEGTVLRQELLLNISNSVLVIITGALLVCCVIEMTVIIIILVRNRKSAGKVTSNASNNGENDGSAEDLSNYAGEEQVELNYAALNFTSRKISGKSQSFGHHAQELPQACIYSGIKDGY